ncbi:MAG: hypothetical protein MUC88_18615, partial [Planctomycetes bacterium]|nr:hypothetical protein [Planctomycetota bacterium]
METKKQDAGKTARVRERRRRRWPWILVGLLLLILAIGLLVPVVLSSRGFTRWIQARISESTGGQADIRDLSVGWFRGVQVAGFSLRGPNGWTQVDVDRITTGPDYGSLLSGNLALGRTIIDQPRVAIDLRERPPSEQKAPMDMSNLGRIGEVIVRDGRVQLTDTTGQTTQIGSLDSQMNLQPPGRTSTLRADLVVLAAAQQAPGRVTVVGEATPSRKTGWSLRGTTGAVTVEVNDLNLASVAPFLDLAGVQVQAQGRVSGNITSAIDDGQIRNLDATITGQDIEIAGDALQRDQLQTAQLNIQARLKQSGDTIDVSQLSMRTDWATVSATGTVPKTPGSLSGLLQRGTAYDLRGNFDINLAAVLSQMPNTLGVRPGMEITGGRATGTINTVTEAGRAALVAKAEIAGLAGVVDNEKVRLSAPVQTTMQLSTGEQGARLDNLTVTAPFATVNASGNFEQIQYQGQADLARLQAELGPFVNLGTYELAGRVTTKGQVAIAENVTNVAGTLSAQQLVLAAADGNSIAEPQANVNFAVGINGPQQALTIQDLTAQAGFGTLRVQNAVVPTGPNSPASLNLLVTADKVDLSRLEPYAEFFGALPRDLSLGGIAQSRVTVARQENLYRFSSDATRIQDFRVATPGEEPFQQPQVTAVFNVAVDPNRKTLHDATWQIQSPQITLKGRITQTSQDNTVKAQGAVDGKVDWAALAPLASGFVPGQLTLAGQRPMAINFTSVYPADDPNGLLAHLNSQAALGFDQAAYLGFDIGPTELDLRAENGLVTIAPVSTTVNRGKVNFAGSANFRQTPAVLTTPATLNLAQGIQINEQTARTLLKYVNPLFADAVRVSGIANLDVRQMRIPLQGNVRTGAQLDGTLSINKLQLGTSNLLNQILGVVGESIEGQVLTLHPTVLTLQKGILRYDDMQIDIGDNPV